MLKFRYLTDAPLLKITSLPHCFLFAGKKIDRFPIYVCFVFATKQCNGLKKIILQFLTLNLPKLYIIVLIRFNALHLFQKQNLTQLIAETGVSARPGVVSNNDSPKIMTPQSLFARK